MKKAGIVAYWLLIVVPPAAYILVNFYWWLFDGNVLNADKMFGAIMAVVITFAPGCYLLAEEWD